MTTSSSASFPSRVVARGPSIFSQEGADATCAVPTATPGASGTTVSVTLAATEPPRWKAGRTAPLSGITRKRETTSPSRIRRETPCPASFSALSLVMTMTLFV